ncbi:MAG TPA: universal stress protein [Aeromonadales bacterium]|nr:universal stress protein [Aeromonadales bacterium]
MNSKASVVISCIDGSSVSEAVADYSGWIASRLSLPVKLLHTIEHSHQPALTDYTGAIGLGSKEELLKELTDVEQNRSRLLIQQGQKMLNGIKQHLMSHFDNDVETSQQHGALAETLLAFEKQTDFIVMGVRGEEHDNTEAGVGRQLESVIRSIHKPICVVNTAFHPPSTIMLAIDGSDSCKKALNFLVQSELFKGLKCHIVHVGENGENLLSSAAAVLSDAHYAVETAQLSGDIAEALTRYQLENGVDITVMGAFSHGRLHDLLMGSFTVKMLSATKRPLILLH